ncbi:GNAT family N-acetyltransferase [Pelomonas sp. V22]|uniref:GNAT family N-acetyltransferase n=1 Tax=Pelomonas sp. V22 TaxID=2822139 RepID=UPI0032C04861
MIQFQAALPHHIAACIVLRGKTRQNAVSAARLAELGVTGASWSADVQAERLLGILAFEGEQLAGYCFGDATSGEIVVLALLPAFEDQGLGRALLDRAMSLLRELGHQRLFLGCSADPASRSHGFYRHLGWVPTGKRDRLGDEELEFLFASAEPRPAERLRAYLQAYEARDLARVGRQFADDIRLVDWNLAVQGKAAALDETRKNFESVRSLSIELLAIYEGEGDGEHRAAAELEIVIDGSLHLHVIDALRFDAAGRITEIRAYKGL